jgi:hypothetical protein
VVAIVIALVGLLGVLIVSYAFYAVGRAEDRERERAAAPPPAPEPQPQPEPHRQPPGLHEPGALARERARKRPPRRPG